MNLANEESSNAARYKKIEKIGGGSYGMVYKAQDQVTKNFVALKKLLPLVSDLV